VATQADAAVVPTHEVAASSQHQVACGADLAAGPCVQAQASPSAQADLSSNPEASSSNPQARSSVDKDGRNDFLNALFRCPITKVRYSKVMQPLYDMVYLSYKHCILYTPFPGQACYGQPHMLYEVAFNSGEAAFVQPSAQTTRNMSFLILVVPE